MSAKSITTSANKPDPSINARVYNLSVDGNANITGNITGAGIITAKGSDRITVPMTFSGGLLNAPISVNFFANKNVGHVDLSIIPFDIPSAGQNASGIVTTTTTLPAALRPQYVYYFTYQGFRLPSTGASTSCVMSIFPTGFITFYLDATAASFTGGGSGNVAGPAVANTFGYAGNLP